jgi:hypothetical protein
MLVALKSALDLDCPLDAAVWAAATTAFWGVARAGEVTTTTLQSFKPNRNPTLANLKWDVDHNGDKVTIIHLPWTKIGKLEGEDIYWAQQNSAADPYEAMRNHLRVNNPTPLEHLFAHTAKRNRRPLLRSCFQKRLEKAAKAALITLPQSHGLRIGGTLEYLLRGIPFQAMLAKGRWRSNAFLEYLRKHAKIMAPYMQDNPVALRELARAMIQPI